MPVSVTGQVGIAGGGHFLDRITLFDNRSTTEPQVINDRVAQFRTTGSFLRFEGSGAVMFGPGYGNGIQAGIAVGGGWQTYGNRSITEKGSDGQEILITTHTAQGGIFFAGPQVDIRIADPADASIRLAATYSNLFFKGPIGDLDLIILPSFSEYQPDELPPIHELGAELTLSAEIRKGAFRGNGGIRAGVAWRPNTLVQNVLPPDENGNPRDDVARFGNSNNLGVPATVYIQAYIALGGGQQ